MTSVGYLAGRKLILMGKSGQKAPKRSQLRRQREREQRYLTILEAAENLFSRKGYHEASMEEIADLAEVSVGTVYFYFKNKEDLMLQMLEKIGYQLRDLLGREFEKADGSIEGFKRAGIVFFEEFCLNYPEKVAIFFRESAGQSRQMEAHRKKIFDKLIGDVQRALLKVSDNLGVSYQSEFSAEVMAVSIMGMYERIAYQYLIWQNRSKDLKTLGHDAVDFIVGGIRNLIK
jgi:AcrR family transcriptional regulator